uniref:EF-hand domain-containing protein n=1 Tax=Lotharella globosa TaxID=91324 RepID=A0A7S3ZAV5_9EUKA
MDISGGALAIRKLESQNTQSHLDKRLAELRNEDPAFTGLSIEEIHEKKAMDLTTEIFKQADTNNDRIIAFDEFSKWYSGGSPEARKILEIFNEFSPRETL